MGMAKAMASIISINYLNISFKPFHKQI